MKLTTQAAAVTRCPHCAAKFRVRAEQVKLHAGLVRCGACRGIFDAIEHLIEGSLPAVDSIDDHSEVKPPETIIQGMPGMQPQLDTGGADQAHTNPVRSTARADDGQRSDALASDSLRVRNLDADAEPQSDPDQQTPTPLSGYRWRPPPQAASPALRWIFALFSIVGLLALVAQSVYFFRDEIASRMQALAPSLATACEYLDCRLAPPKRGESLGFVGTDLAADPAHKGLLIFTATLRNSGASAVAYPHLVLTLDGLGGELVARRVFAPTEFAPATASLTRGLDAGAEIEIKLYLDASAVNIVGFKVDHAYL